MGPASSGFFKAGDDARLPAAAGHIGCGPLVDSVRKCGHLARRGANELAEPPRPRIEAARIVDMTSSNEGATVRRVFCSRSVGCGGASKRACSGLAKDAGEFRPGGSEGGAFCSRAIGSSRRRDLLVHFTGPV
jgi:hypothetical protein